MSPWALNTLRGCNIQNDDFGTIPSSTAIPVTDRQALIAKHLRGVIVFDNIVGIDIEKVSKSYLGIELSKINEREKNWNKEMRSYESFMKEFKDPKIAAQKWSEYKKSLGMKEVEKKDDKPNSK